MHEEGLRDTIAAIATATGESGIGIVRISGPEALAIADSLFRAKDGKKPSGYKTHTVHYGWIIEPLSELTNPQTRELANTLTRQTANPQTRKPANPQTGVIDEVLLTVMRAPRTYTKEDIVEINCHGGVVALRRVTEAVLACGARLAGPGEFTRRAFLNGRIDLAQAEAVLDIIRAKTGAALKAGVEQLNGRVSREIEALRDSLLDVQAALEAQIDFPEEDIGEEGVHRVFSSLAALHAALKSLVDASRYGRVLREGVRVVICGKANVGKSSLLNALVKQERSIVTALPGTTRDTVEELIDIRGIPVRIVYRGDYRPA